MPFKLLGNRGLYAGDVETERNSVGGKMSNPILAKTSGNTKLATLKELVKRLGSQDEAARYLSVSLVTISRWIRGKNRPHKLAQKYLAERGVRVE